MKKARNSHVFFLEKRLVTSKAWLLLKGLAPKVYLLFRLKCRVEQVEQIGKRNKRTEWIITNNGEIMFTYSEAFIKYDIQKSTFLRAIDELVEKGFLDIAESGRGYKKLASKYRISDRWRKYGTHEFVKAHREKATWNQGFKKKSSVKIGACQAPIMVLVPQIMVLRTGPNGEVSKTAYKLKKKKWLQEKIA